MPAIISGPLNIVNIAGTGVVNFGASASVSPKYASKAFAGCGCFSTGAWSISTNGLNSTNVLDPNLMDQATVGNN